MKSASEKKIAKLLAAMGNPFRINVLLAIGEGEACVCHLEAVLKQRQAYISQHLMALRKAGLLETRREGKFIFYRLSDPGALSLVYQAAALAGAARDHLPSAGAAAANCVCPKCVQEEAG